MEYLFSDAQRFTDAIALIDENGTRITFRELAERADQTALGFGTDRTLVMIEIANAVEPILAYIGALRAGHAVILTGADAVGNAQLAESFGVAMRYHRTDAWGIERTGATAPPLHPDLAVLLSTSGSTGSPKLVKLSHANLIANAASIAEYLELSTGERAITSLPLYYSFGLSVLHSHLLFGHGIVLTEHSVADPAFWRIVDREGVTSIAGVPHSYGLLTHSGFLDREHRSLRYMTQAGGKLSVELVRLFAEHADKHGQRFYVMYGQTEASPRMAYLPPYQALSHPDCIGVPLPGGAFRLEAIDDTEGLPTGAGELIYEGPNVMMGYALSPADLSAEPGPAELSTGDVAVQEPTGLYKIVGRMSRFVKLFGLRISLDEIERRLAAQGIAAVAAGDDRGIVVATTVADAEPRVAELLGATIKLPPASYLVLELDEIPRLPSGKADYRALIARRDARGAAGNADARLSAQIADLLGVATIPKGASFVDLGGDSLNYVRVAMLIDEHLGTLPPGWENMPIAELEALDPRMGSRIATVESSVLMRAIAIFMVLFHHASRLPISGAALVLLVIAGLNFSRFQSRRLIAGGLRECFEAIFWRAFLPYICVLIFMAIFFWQPVWPSLLFYSNYLPPVPGNPLGLYWFMETYLTITIALYLLFSVPTVGHFYRDHGWTAAMILLATMIVVRSVWFRATGTPGIYDWTPLTVGWLFVMGMAIHQATTLPRLILLFAIAAAMVIPVRYLEASPVYLGSYLFLGYLAVLMFVKSVPVGKWAQQAVTIVSGASLYIYMAQPIGLRLGFFAERYVSYYIMVPVIVAMCLIIGLAVWRASVWAEQWIASRREQTSAFARPAVSPEI